MKLPKYVDDILDHLGKCEERAIGTPYADASARMRKELIDESLTAKNPIPKPENVNPWPADNKIPADFKPNFKNWLDWKSNDSFCLNVKAKFEDHPDVEEDVCVMDGRMSFIYPFTCQGPRGCPDTDHDWIHISVEDSVLNHADDEKRAIKDPYSGGELVITNWRAIMRELIEKGMKQEGYGPYKANPRSIENKEKAKSILSKLLKGRMLMPRNRHQIKQYLKEKGIHLSIPEIKEALLEIQEENDQKLGLNPRRSDGMKPSDFDQEQLYIGTQVEREHTDDVREAQRIAMDHLAEDADYYKKLKACVEPEETWVDDEEEQMEQSNPSRPTVSELAKVFRGTIKDPFTGMSIRGFDESALGKQLSAAEKDEVWRDIQLFIQKMVDQMMEKVMGLNLSREGGKPGALEFSQTKGETRGESWEAIEENRYYKLFFTSYLMSLLLRFFYVSAPGAKKVFDVLEGKKLGEKNGWRRLAQFGNREANAESIYIGMLALMNKVSSGNLALWLDEHPDHIAKLYEDADTRWKKILAERGKEGKKELESLHDKRRKEKAEITSLEPAGPEGVKARRGEISKEKIASPDKKETGVGATKKRLKEYKKEAPISSWELLRLESKDQD